METSHPACASVHSGQVSAVRSQVLPVWVAVLCPSALLSREWDGRGVCLQGWVGPWDGRYSALLRGDPWEPVLLNTVKIRPAEEVVGKGRAWGDVLV